MLSMGLLNLATGQLVQADDSAPAQHLQADPAQVTVDAIFAKLEKIRIPKVRMENTTIEEAIDFLRLRTLELGEDLAPKGVALPRPQQEKAEEQSHESAPLGGGPDQVSLRVTYSADNMTLAALFKEFAKQTKLDVYVTSVGVVLCPSGQPPFSDEKSSAGRKWKLLFKYEPPPTGAKP